MQTGGVVYIGFYGRYKGEKEGVKRVWGKKVEHGRRAKWEKKKKQLSIHSFILLVWDMRSVTAPLGLTCHWDCEIRW